MLNNGGYTVERLIHGKEAFYNEVAILHYSLLGKTFGPVRIQVPRPYQARLAGSYRHSLGTPSLVM